MFSRFLSAVLYINHMKKKFALLPEDHVSVSQHSELLWQHWYQHGIPAGNHFNYFNTVYNMGSS